MSQLDFLYEPTTNKYIIDFVIALITVFLNIITDDLRGWQYLYKASHIETGAINWTFFTVYLTLFIPHYFGDKDKLMIFSFVLVFFWLMTIGCWVVRTLGQSWKSHESISRIALTGSPLVLTVLSFAIFIFFDYYFSVIGSHI
jgi:hypothetical protein